MSTALGVLLLCAAYDVLAVRWTLAVWRRNPEAAGLLSGALAGINVVGTLALVNDSTYAAPIIAGYALGSFLAVAAETRR